MHCTPRLDVNANLEGSIYYFVHYIALLCFILKKSLHSKQLNNLSIMCDLSGWSIGPLLAHVGSTTIRRDAGEDWISNSSDLKIYIDGIDTIGYRHYRYRWYLPYRYRHAVSTISVPTVSTISVPTVSTISVSTISVPTEATISMCKQQHKYRSCVHDSIFILPDKMIFLPFL